MAASSGSGPARPETPLVVVTWNLHGRARPDLDRVAEELARSRPDIVGLQEVQRAQARALARRLGWHWAWGFKHWPVAARAEGAAILTRHQLDPARTTVLQPAAPIRWQRRIALTAACRLADGRVVHVVSAHLSPQGPPERRRHELAELARQLKVEPRGPGRPAPMVVVLGDLNTDRLDELAPVLEHQGWIDCWSMAGRRSGDGPTHTTGQRLDYILAPAGTIVTEARVPTDRRGDLAPLSDHLPVAVELHLGP